MSVLEVSNSVSVITQPDIRWITPDEVRRHHIGSVLNGGGAWPGGHKHATLADWLALAVAFDDAALATDAPTPIPLLWGTLYISLIAMIVAVPLGLFLAAGHGEGSAGADQQ